MNITKIGKLIFILFRTLYIFNENLTIPKGGGESAYPYLGQDLHRKNHIKTYQTTTSFYSIIRFGVDKKQFFSIKKIRNSGNCIYDYAHYIYIYIYMVFKL